MTRLVAIATLLFGLTLVVVATLQSAAADDSAPGIERGQGANDD